MHNSVGPFTLGLYKIRKMKMAHNMTKKKIKMRKLYIKFKKKKKDNNNKDNKLIDYSQKSSQLDN